MKKLKNFLVMLGLFLIPNFLLAEGIDKLNTTANNFYLALHGLAGIVIVGVVLFIGYKILFGGKAFQEFTSLILGAVLIAGCAEIGAYLIA